MPALPACTCPMFRRWMRAAEYNVHANLNSNHPSVMVSKDLATIWTVKQREAAGKAEPEGAVNRQSSAALRLRSVAPFGTEQNDGRHRH